MIQTLRSRYIDGFSLSQKREVKKKIQDSRIVINPKIFSARTSNLQKHENRTFEIKSKRKADSDRNLSLSVFARDSYDIARSLEFCKRKALEDLSSRCKFLKTWKGLFCVVTGLRIFSKAFEAKKKEYSFIGSRRMILIFLLKIRLKVSTLTKTNQVSEDLVKNLLKSCLPVLLLNRQLYRRSRFSIKMISLMKRYAHRFLGFKAKVKKVFLEELKKFRRFHDLAIEEAELFSHFFRSRPKGRSFEVPRPEDFQNFFYNLLE